MLRLLLPSLLAGPAWAVEWTTGQDVSHAVYLDVTPEAFASIEGIAAAVLPPTIPIDSTGLEGGGEIDLLLIGTDYSFSVENVYILPEIQDLSIVPTTDALVVDLRLRASVSEPASPAVIRVDANLNLLFDLISFGIVDEDCAMHLDNADIDVHANLGLKILRDPRNQVPVLDDQGRIQLDVDFQEVSYTLPPLELSDLNLGDAAGGSCVIDDLLELADWLGIPLVDLVISEITPTIDAQIETLVNDLEPQVEDAFDALFIETELDLLGAPLAVGVFPNDLHVTEEGLRLELSGSFDSGPAPHPCVSRFDTGRSQGTLPLSDPRYPFVGEAPVGVAPGVGILVDDDWMNQAMYAVWRGGLLCQEIRDGQSPVELPIPINTTLLGLIAAGQFNDLFPEAAPLVLTTRPEQPPTVLPGAGGHDLTIDVQQLGLDLVAELDGRLSRVVGLDLAAQAGVDLNFDGTTGELGVAVAFDPAQITADVSFNDLKAEASAAVESGFATLAETIVPPLLEGALGDISFALPSFSGLGLVSADVGTVGPIDDYLGVIGAVGPVPYGDAAAGCDALGLSDTTGCAEGTSCAQAGAQRGWLFGGALGVALLRRRRRS
jgi:hypothetical protein